MILLQLLPLLLPPSLHLLMLLRLLLVLLSCLLFFLLSLLRAPFVERELERQIASAFVVGSVRTLQAPPRLLDVLCFRNSLLRSTTSSPWALAC